MLLHGMCWERVEGAKIASIASSRSSGSSIAHGDCSGAEDMAACLHPLARALEFWPVVRCLGDTGVTVC
eukprot:604540-Hanusia_phi.AAC.1